MARFRYGSWHEGPDPLASPFDVEQALDQLGDDVLAGSSAREALERLTRRGLSGRHGLDDLRRKTRERRKQMRRSGRLDATLEQARRLLDTAIGQERAALFPDPSDDARFREAALDALPADTARAIQELADYDWRSPQARQTFDQLRDLLRGELLDSQFRGMKQALEQAGSDPETMRGLTEMLRDLSDLLDADARGELSDEQRQERFERFMAEHGQFLPDHPATLDELIDSLARRQAAAARLVNSLTPEQQDELAALSQAVLGDPALREAMGRINDQLRARRPDLDWGGRQHMQGDQPLGLGEATTALEELADLEELEASLGQDYPGATLEDVDEEAVRRALGQQAVDDLQALRRIERELAERGYLVREGGRLELTPKAVRRLGHTALRRVFADLESLDRGGHDVPAAGGAGELTGATRAWRFGDEQPLDVVRTLGNAVRRGGPRRPVRLAVDDFEVVETETRTRAAVALLVDLSYSMALRDTWGAAKATAMALHSLVSTQYPQDSIQVIGFANMARVLAPTELASLDVSRVQGTNLQHALMLAGRFLDRHPRSERIVLVITDGEPTAHLLSDGSWWFDWPPDPRTLEVTLAEVDRMTRRGATVNVFMLDDDPRLMAFVDEVARRNGGRVLATDPDRLGEYVVTDYLRLRRGRRAARGQQAG